MIRKYGPRPWSLLTWRKPMIRATCTCMPMLGISALIAFQSWNAYWDHLTRGHRSSVVEEGVNESGGTVLSNALLTLSVVPVAPFGDADPLPNIAEALRLPSCCADAAELRSEAQRIVWARTIVEAARRHYAEIKDYTATMIMRERIDGVLGEPTYLNVKIRNQPHSVYLRYLRPSRGKEAIYVEGCRDNQVWAHEAPGLFKLLTGTVKLDPTSPLAMRGHRYPITDLSMGHLLKTVSERWTVELQEGRSLLAFPTERDEDGRELLGVRCIHVTPAPGDFFHRVDLWFDMENGLPVKYAAFSQPPPDSDEPVLEEEYVTRDLRINVGLTDHDFDPANPNYSFSLGR